MVGEKTEKSLIHRLEREFGYYGHWYLNIHGSGMGSRRGMPDFFVVANGQPVGIECKRYGGEPTFMQLVRGMELVKAGGRFIIAYPDFTVDMLENVDGIPSMPGGVVQSVFDCNFYGLDGWPDSTVEMRLDNIVLT